MTGLSGSVIGIWSACINGTTPKYQPSAMATPHAKAEGKNNRGLGKNDWNIDPLLATGAMLTPRAGTATGPSGMAQRDVPAAETSGCSIGSGHADASIVAHAKARQGWSTPMVARQIGALTPLHPQALRCPIEANSATLG